MNVFDMEDFTFIFSRAGSLDSEARKAGVEVTEEVSEEVEQESSKLRVVPPSSANSNVVFVIEERLQKKI